MKKVSDCPKGSHFHVMGNDVFETDSFTWIIEATDPNDALSKTLDKLPDNWEGSIEVNDHSTLKPSDMPLLDFWRTPIRK